MVATAVHVAGVMALTRDQVRLAIDIDHIIDRLVESGDPLDSHPLQVSGEEISWLEQVLTHLTMRWLQRRGITVE